MLELRQKSNVTPSTALQLPQSHDAGSPSRAARPFPGLEALGGVVLAGTHPWGRCSLDRAVPRPLLPVANRPLIHYALEWMGHSSNRQIVVCGNSDTPALRGGLADLTTSHRNLSFYVDPMPRGPAGCVRDAAQRQSFQHVLVADGTIVPEVDVDDLLSHHVRSGAALTLVAAPNPWENSHHADQWVPVGIYVFSAPALEMIPKEGYQDIKESLVPRLHRTGLRVSAYPAADQTPRVTGTADYLPLNDWAVEIACAATRPPGRFLRVRQAWVHESAVVHPSVQLIGAVMVGEQCAIGRHAVVLGPTSIGTHSRIEAEAVVCRSVIWNEGCVETGGHLDRCVLTHHARCHAGASHTGTVLLPEAVAPPLRPWAATLWPHKTTRSNPVGKGRRRQRAEFAA